MSSSITTGAINEITSTEEFENYKSNCGDMLVVVDFYADWCGPCKSINPTFKELAKDNLDVCFLKVNVDEQEEIAAMCEVTCMPTFNFYKKGELVKSFSGANKDTLKALVAELKKKDAKK